MFHSWRHFGDKVETTSEIVERDSGASLVLSVNVGKTGRFVRVRVIRTY